MSTVSSPVTKDLAGRVAVITGASSGMGRSTALLLAARGAKVALLARREAALEALAAEIRRGGGEALALVTDVTDQAAVDAAAADEGRVVDLINTSSIAGQNIFPYFAAYSATKAYVSHLTRHLRVELGPKNIRVSVLEPGITSTELQGHVTFQGATDWLENAAKSIDFLQADDIARTVVFIVTQPKHMNLQQVVIMPTKEAT